MFFIKFLDRPFYFGETLTFKIRTKIDYSISFLSFYLYYMPKGRKIYGKCIPLKMVHNYIFLNKFRCS